MGRKVKDISRVEFDKETQCKISEKFKVKAKTDGQQYFLDAIEDSQIVMCCGPAGSGKSYLALARGLELIRQGKYKQIMLFRPLQECGRQIGHLPGDKKEKMEPHIQTFMSIFGKLVPKEILEGLLRDGIIKTEIIEFTRGATFDDSYIVVDESQNCSFQQLCMLITRISDTSKIVFVGDTKQIDLSEKFMVNGRCAFDVFMERLEVLEDDEIATVELTEADIVRSKLLGKICRALGI